MKYKWKTTNKKLFYFDQSILQLNRLYKKFFLLEAVASTILSEFHKKFRQVLDPKDLKLVNF